MPNAWRIVREKHAGSAFTGEGSARFGGRWNSRGRAVVYSSGSKSLAALEILVHLNPPIPFKYVAWRLEFDAKLLVRVTAADLPADWRLEPPPPSTRQLGDAWLQSQRSPILAVPSVIIPGELNFLLNPAHREFKQISIGEPEPFAFDPRLLS